VSFVTEKTEKTADRRERLEQELAAARAGLGRAADSETAAHLEMAVQELEKELETMLLAIEIERQSDA
jgi:uncharacterized heparinase superfamily protein